MDPSHASKMQPPRLKADGIGTTDNTPPKRSLGETMRIKEHKERKEERKQTFPRGLVVYNIK